MGARDRRSNTSQGICEFMLWRRQCKRCYRYARSSQSNGCRSRCSICRGDWMSRMLQLRVRLVHRGGSHICERIAQSMRKRSKIEGYARRL